MSHGLFEIEIIDTGNGCCLVVNEKSGKFEHKSVHAAKSRLFEIMENGELMAHFNGGFK